MFHMKHKKYPGNSPGVLFYHGVVCESCVYNGYIFITNSVLSLNGGFVLKITLHVICPVPDTVFIEILTNPSYVSFVLSLKMINGNIAMVPDLANLTTGEDSHLNTVLAFPDSNISIFT